MHPHCTAVLRSVAAALLLGSFGGALTATVPGCTVDGGIRFPDADLVIPDAGPMRRDGAIEVMDSGPLPPGCVEEICDNELDDDCDGVVENGCGCIPGESSACFAGRAENRGRGLCVDGVMVCGEGLEWGAWGDCVGDIAPATEICDVAELDENCNGAANEGCECTGAEPIPCGSDEGACGAGVQQCVDGLRGECVGATGPVAEDCNGIDDDCDGATDETLMQACGSDVGECQPGTQTCAAGVWDACVGSIDATDEACDGLDQDCDGMTDEDLVRDCGSAVGACLPGTQTCTGATWLACTGDTGPIVEDCNALDDDCDGLTDESLMQACGSDVGECMAGTEICAGGSWGSCAGSIGPRAEACDGVRDDDCDGTPDNGCLCTTGTTRDCGMSVGACVFGTETCDATGNWGTCVGGTGPGTETCNDVDDDCDGRTDEAISMACGTDLGACTVGTQTCTAGVFGSCTGGVLPGTERCDVGMVDEDCDGLSNEGCACTNGDVRACPGGTDTGACAAGTQTCDLSGIFGACMGAIGPTSETCNGIDDDCDGTTDGMTRGCGSDTGECVAGTQTCTAGAFGSCVGEVVPRAESCVGSLDEDCDGLTNEGCACTAGAMQNCGTDVGACSFGSQTCSVAGTWGVCTGGVGAVAETCNGIDDDCDGSTDEALTQSCGSTDVGACAFGTQTCTGGSFGACVGSIGPSAELCDAGRIDEDCDGVQNEGCVCVTGTTQSCGTATGDCATGTQTCDAAGQWGACTGGIGPAPEVCDNRDNDCDGSRDEGLTQACGTDLGVCVAGTQTCSAGSWGSCSGSVGPATEVCDAPMLDEDCDGSNNEGCACFNGQTRACGTDVGLCAFGTSTCNLSGVWGSCVGGTNPATEICDTLDNDCDGMVDENNVCVTFPPTVMCPAGLSANVLSTVTLAGSGSDPDGGTVTYSWTVTSRPVGSTANPTSPTSATTSFFLDAAGSYSLQFCVTDDEGERSCCTTTITSLPPGVLHVELSWAEGSGDLDLHLRNIGLSGTTGWFTTNDCYFGNRTPDWGPVGAAANPTLDRDDRDGYGPENTTITTSPAAGTYTIAVHDYCRPTTGTGTATVRIYCGTGAPLVRTVTGIIFDETDEWVNVATVTWPSCATSLVGGSSTYGSALVPLGVTPHCEMSCTTSADCHTGERCLLVGGGGPPRNACIHN